MRSPSVKGYVVASFLIFSFILGARSRLLIRFLSSYSLSSVSSLTVSPLCTQCGLCLIIRERLKKLSSFILIEFGFILSIDVIRALFISFLFIFTAKSLCVPISVREFCSRFYFATDNRGVT